MTNNQYNDAPPPMSQKKKSQTPNSRWQNVMKIGAQIKEMQTKRLNAIYRVNLELGLWGRRDSSAIESTGSY